MIQRTVQIYFGLRKRAAAALTTQAASARLRNYCPPLDLQRLHYDERNHGEQKIVF